MKMEFTLDEIRTAFQRVEGHVAAQGVEAECMWALHAAIEDEIRILSADGKPGNGAPAEDELRLAALEARTVESFDAATLRLGAFADRPQVERARNEIDPAWRPRPAGNEAMLEALEIYAEKRTGALGRGSARSEADIFALIEARRVYLRVTRG